jgi:hypothetical protein
MPLSDFRQTDFTTEQIIQILKSRHSYPRCGLINELGILAQEDKVAEAELRRLLPLEIRDNEKFAAYGLLSLIKNPDEETVEVLERFRSIPENEEIVNFADKKNAVSANS